jgi:hypothetical protein
MNINCTFQFKKVRKMQNLGNVYIWGSPFAMSRTDAQNGVDIIFNYKIVIKSFIQPAPGFYRASKAQSRIFAGFSFVEL